MTVFKTRTALAAICGAAILSACAASTDAAGGMSSKTELSSALDSAVSASTRTPANVARDRYRHPTETLAYFGLEPDDTVVEIWPGGGWYSEILAPYLKSGGGTLYVAAPWERGLNGVRKLASGDPVYSVLSYAAFPAKAGEPTVPMGSADVVLTFRNVHNWRFGGEDVAQKAFEDMYAMLKPGGTLGVVEHRLPESMDSAMEENSGYMKTSSVIGYARAAGFEVTGESEINANARDTHDHPRGVWTLPPTFRLEDTDRAKYAAIGESDRMTLKFRKPR